MSDLIHFIMTGGTIDSAWDGTLDAIVVSEHSHLPGYLEKHKLISETQFTEVCMKDSREITDEDRAQIVKAIEESPSTQIIVTHGTFTMPDTAKFLKKKLKRDDQTIVFTGAVTPLRSFELTDAGLNLGFAISQVQYLPAGIYIAMKGKAFTIEDVEKQLKEGKFHEIFSSSN